MPHRNALAAAQAKIAALERALDEARGGPPADDSLRSQVGQLELMLSAAHAERRVAEDRAEKAEGELDRMRADHARREHDAREHERDARERAARAAALPGRARDVRTLLTLDQHNRSLPRPPHSDDWEPAGVLCPACFEEGERVELGMMPIHQTLGATSFAQVICPRCGALGAKREA